MSSVEQNNKVLSSCKEDGTDRFNDRLLELASSYDSQASFAVACGISVSGIQRLLAGGMPRLPILVSIAKGNRVNLEWLATGKGDKHVDKATSANHHIYDNAGNIVDLNGFTFIPRYDVSASTGYGCDICQENFIYSIAYRTYWIKNYLKVNPKALIAVTARGDSMTGVIDDRDVVIVDTTNKSLSDGIYVLRLDGNLIVKSAQKLPNSIVEISSTNPMYRSFQIDMKKPPNDLDIIGCVIHTEPGALCRRRKCSNTV